MQLRIHSTLVLAKRRIFEVLIRPGYYIALCIGLIMGYILISGFVNSIDSSGFNFEMNPLYDLIVRILHGAFGAAFLETFFAEGPFLLVIIISVSPVLIYLVYSTIFKFGFERKTGAAELLIYGPVDGTVFFSAFIIKDIFFTLLSIGILFIFLFLSAIVNNLLLGSLVFYTLFFLVFLSASIYAYGILISVIVKSTISAIISFSGIIVFFLFIMMNSYTISSNYINTLSDVFSWIFQWISPFFYWNLCMNALETGDPGGYIISILSLLALSFILLLLSGFVLKKRGIRA